jgi:probable rRNA maturation factor
MSVAIAVPLEDPRWRRRIPDVAPAVRRAARAALAGARRGGAAVPAAATLAVALADDAQLRALNHDFRGRDKPTNVLSFPDGALRPDGTTQLGDVALAFETCAAEARAQGKTLRAHLTHLVVHGVLHLLGHDHERPGDALRMEALEREILARLKIADPYAPRGAAR